MNKFESSVEIELGFGYINDRLIYYLGKLIYAATSVAKTWDGKSANLLQK